MAQPRGEQAPGVVRLAIDIGCSNVKAFLSENPDSDSVDYPLEFPSSGDDRRRATTELDTSIVFSENGDECIFGSDGWSLSRGHVIVDWKLGAMGLDPYASRLARACEQLRESAPHLKDATTATIYNKTFKHILDTAKEHLSRKYGRSFDGIECYLTYPVSCSESLKLLLYQEASAVGLNVMGGVSESLAAAYYIKSETSLELPSGAKLIIDFGGATVDASVVYEDSMGRIMQACASHGFPGGGQMINETARNWLKDQCRDWKALDHDTQWALSISPLLDRCKRSFTGRSGHDMYYGDGKIVTIPCDDMQSFFEPLISGGVRLAQDMSDRARLAGHPVETIVVCGGVMGNRWFFEEFCQRQRAKTGIERCMRVPEPEIVAHGALAYSRTPIVEERVIAQGLGLSYIGDYTKSGRPLKHGAWHTGIGWILSEGQPPSELPRQLIFTKDIEPGSEDEGDRLIETDIYATSANSKEFGQHIRKNELIDWDCEITYPVTDSIISSLLHLGKVSGKLPHKEMFPPGTEMEESEFEFQLTLKADKNLLKAQFSVRLQDGTLCPLRDVRYVPLPLLPRSEYLNRCIPSGQSLSNKSAGEDQPPNHEEQNAFSSGSSVSVFPVSRDVSASLVRHSPAIVEQQNPDRTGNAKRGISALTSSDFNPAKRSHVPTLRPPRDLPTHRKTFQQNIARDHIARYLRGGRSPRPPRPPRSAYLQPTVT